MGSFVTRAGFITILYHVVYGFVPHVIQWKIKQEKEKQYKGKVIGEAGFGIFIYIAEK